MKLDLGEPSQTIEITAAAPLLQTASGEVSLNIEEKTIIRKTIFGTDFIDRKTGEPLQYTQRIFTGYNNVLRFEGVPVFYFPWIQGNVEDPLGPLAGITFGIGTGAQTSVSC